MTVGPSRGPTHHATPICQLTTSLFASPNRFQSLSLNTTTDLSPTPEYCPLGYIDVDIKGTLDSGEGWVSTRALIDSGGQGSFINDKLFEYYQHLPCLTKPQPISLILADGRPSKGGNIKSYSPLTLRIASNQETIALDVAPTTHHIVLGTPWLERHDPVISYKRRTVTFTSNFCRTHCTHYNQTLELHSEPSPSERKVQVSLLGEEKPYKGDGPRKVLPPRNLRKVSHTPVSRKPLLPKNSVDSVKAPLEAPKISTVGPHAFATLLNQPGVELFTMSFSDLSQIEINNISNDSGGGDGNSGTDLSNIPPEYHDLAGLFSEKEAMNLPPHRSYDHTIPLEAGSTPPFGPIYSMSPAELAALKKYVEDNLKKGFIRHSQSPCGAPILFAKKSDGTLRLCVDYRGLNKITTKNRYPLPLIGELLDRISRAKYFTKFDVRDGYHRLRMASGEEWKTAFRCRYGLYEYTVMPFGLCNAPGTFQHYMNDTFREFLDEFLIVYLDDLLIYSDTLAEHKVHVRRVMEKLHDAGLFLKPSKCQFHVQEVAFLGFIVGPSGVKMDPSKVSAIITWPTPKSIHDIRVFLGLANFYRRFIKRFSRVALPITSLLKKDCKFHWDSRAQLAFEALKKAFVSAPILRHFDPALPTIIEADASNHALGAVISQRGSDDGLLHPITFYSRKFNPAELNYEIYDKEMLAIVETLDHFRHYFEGLGQKTTVYSDHRNLLWFTETRVYNRRQVRWAEKLSRYDFIIIFRPGKQGGKPDALSRRPDYTSGDDSASRTITFLKPHHVDTSSLGSEYTAGPRDGSTVRAYSLNAAITQQLPHRVLGTDTPLQEKILSHLDQDQKLSPRLPHLRNTSLPRGPGIDELLRGYSISADGLVLKDGLVYIPHNQELKLQILQTCHDSKTGGHLGQRNTMERVSRNYYWPKMRQFINEYVRTCETCSRNKAPRHRPHGLLHPLPIPTNSWKSVSMDLIVELPSSSGFNSILVCVDRFTKMAHFIPTNSDVDAEGAATLYLRNVFKLHGLPGDIVSDRGSHFTSRFTRRLLELCEIKNNYSTAYHPQSDGQTERTNQTLEQYLRIYCDHQQDDWHDLLPYAEFVYNNTQNSSTQMTPFFANYGYHPRCTLQAREDPFVPINPTAESLIEKFRQLHSRLRENLCHAQATYKEYHDRYAKEPPSFKVGDKVWLNRKNIRTNRPSQKLDFKRLGPFPIEAIVGESKIAYRLTLPHQMRIHPVFHVSLLEPYHQSHLPGRQQPEPPPIEVEGQPEFEVKEILDSKVSNGQLLYYVDWEGYGPTGRQWEPAEHLQHSPEVVAAYHKRYPRRPSPANIPAVRPRLGRKKSPKR